MSTYVIGDVHGCLNTLERLLKSLDYKEGKDRILLTGDLVNGGPDSAGVVRWAREQEAAAVLGNHDLHLLAVAAGARAPRKKDTFFDLLRASDREDLLHWLRTRPMVIHENNLLLVHAGVLPEWNLATALGLAAEVEDCLCDSSRVEFWREMYGNTPRQWNEELTGSDRIRIVINAMTRMRTLTPENEIDLEFSGPPEKAPEHLRPWFSVPGRLSPGTRIFFGHWAALGFYQGENVVGLDSGCAWGGALTAWRLEDGKVFQAPSELRK